MKHLFIVLVLSLLLVGCEKENPMAPLQEPDYKEYVALVSQSDTSAPTATIISNTFGEPPLWVRSSNGTYSANLIGTFPQNKTLCIISSPIIYEQTIGYILQNINTITFVTFDHGNLSDNVFSHTSIEIRVYN